MADTVWVQSGRFGFRLPKDTANASLAEWEAESFGPEPGHVYAIHDGDCALGKVNPNVRMVNAHIGEATAPAPGCTCTPELRTAGAKA